MICILKINTELNNTLVDSRELLNKKTKYSSIKPYSRELFLFIYIYIYIFAIQKKKVINHGSTKHKFNQALSRLNINILMKLLIF